MLIVSLKLFRLLHFFFIVSNHNNDIRMYGWERLKAIPIYKYGQFILFGGLMYIAI